MLVFNPDCISDHDPRMAMPLAEAGRAVKASVAGAPRGSYPELFAPLGPAMERLSQAGQQAADTLVNHGENLGAMFRATASAYRRAEDDRAAAISKLTTDIRAYRGQGQ